jgi:hypothetical protein
MGCWQHVSHCYEVRAMSGSGVDVEPVIRSERSTRQRGSVPIRTSLVVSACLLGLGLAGCDHKDWEAAGYQDGYASTINTTCQFRSSLIHGKWDNEKYARGYARGSSAGATAVARDGCERLR